MAKTKLLITGSAGFICSNLIRKAIYLKLPYEFVSVDKLCISTVMNNIYQHSLHKFYIADICDSHIMNRIFEYEKPDMILHMAAESHVDRSIENAQPFIQSNVAGTQTLIDLAVKHKVDKFVYMSTDEVLGSASLTDEKPLDETAPLNARNPYASSKAAGELLLQAAGNTFGLQYIIMRACNNYGMRQDSSKFIPKMIKAVMDGSPLTIHGNGANLRDWLYVGDCAAAIIKVLMEGKVGEIYHISANQEFSNLEVVNEICNVMGKGHDKIKFVTDRPGNDLRYLISSEKLRGLGWKPEMNFKKGGLANTVEWYVNNQWFLS